MPRRRSASGKHASIAIREHWQPLRFRDQGSGECPRPSARRSRHPPGEERYLAVRPLQPLFEPAERETKSSSWLQALSLIRVYARARLTGVLESCQGTVLLASTRPSDTIDTSTAPTTQSIQDFRLEA